MRERRSPSTLLLVLLFAMVGASVADAAPRKRLVMLGFDGDRASQFRSDLVTILKKRHTVIATAKWEETADVLSASVMDEDNIRRVATKLKIDGILTASAERRRSEYILRINVFAGTTGQLFSNTVYIKARGPQLGRFEERQLDDELLALIADLGTNRRESATEETEEPEETEETGETEEPEQRTQREPKRRERVERKERVEAESDGEEMLTVDDDAESEDTEEADREAAPPKKTKPAPKAKRKKDPTRSGPEVAVAKPTKKPPRAELEVDSAQIEIESDTDDDPLGLSSDTVAADSDDAPTSDSESPSDSDEPGVTAAPRHLSPAERAIDAVVGLSISKRTLSFTYDAAQTQKPPSFDGVPVAGLLIDATVYPFAVGHKRDGMLRHLGVTLLYDKVLMIKLQSFAPQGEAPVELSSTQQRFGLGATFRYPINDSATSPVIGARLSYGRQSFSAQQPPPGHAIPSNVSYSMVEPALFVRYPISDKAVLDAEVGMLVVRSAGQIETAEHYGQAQKRGYEGEVGGSIQLTEKVFGRAALRMETIGLDLGSGGAKAMGVTKARDSYYGASLAAGYVF